MAKVEPPAVRPKSTLTQPRPPTVNISLTTQTSVGGVTVVKAHAVAPAAEENGPAALKVVSIAVAKNNDKAEWTDLKSLMR